MAESSTQHAEHAQILSPQLGLVESAYAEPRLDPVLAKAQPMLNEARADSVHSVLSVSVYSDC